MEMSSIVSKYIVSFSEKIYSDSTCYVITNLFKSALKYPWAFTRGFPKFNQV